jgi:hypothetical protein
MPADVLSIGGIALVGYSPPDAMMAGGKQAMVVHKLPGGSRVIDTLGPDEADISIKGFFFGSDAYSTAQAFDAMRAAGEPVPLVWGGQYRTVIIEDFTYHVRRLPFWVEYDFNLTVVSNPALGALGGIASTIDTLVSGDLGTALGL